MSKICHVCGMMNMDNASVCSKCHSSLGTAGINNQIPPNSRGISHVNQHVGNVQGIDPELEKNYEQYQKSQQTGSKLLRWGLVIAVVAVAGYFGMQYYQNNTPPDASWVKENLPKDVLTCTLDGEEHSLKVKSFKIQSRSTKDGVDHTKCKVVLADNILKKTKYIKLTSRRYSSLGWKVKDWKEYKNEKAALKARKEDAVVSFIQKKYQLDGIKNFQVEKNTPDYVKTYLCDFENQYTYLNYSGQLGVKESLIGLNGEDFEEIENVTGDYNTETVPATIGTTLKWNLDGTYSYNDDDSEFTVTVESDGEDGITWEAAYCLYEDVDAEEYETSGTVEDPTEITNEDESQIDVSEYIDVTDDEEDSIDLTADMKYSFSIGNGYRIVFTRDEVSIYNSEYGRWPGSANEMTKID
mgnify:CR=1 FL=1